MVSFGFIVTFWVVCLFAWIVFCFDLCLVFGVCLIVLLLLRVGIVELW